VGLCLIAAASWSTWALEWVYVITAVSVALGIVIFVHELGHFLVAKACGVKCEKFLIGFDVPIKIGPWKLPRTLLKWQWGETEYAVGIIPLGGYVKMLGQDDNPANAKAEAERCKISKAKTTDENNQTEQAEQTDATEQATVSDQQEQPSEQTSDQASEQTSDQEQDYELDPRSYMAKSVPQRMAIISAGVAMNLVFAVIFATIAYGAGVLYTPCKIGDTLAGSPAYKANLDPGCHIISIANGHPSEHLRFRMDLLQNVGMTGGKEELNMRIRFPNGEEKDIAIQPVEVEVGRRKAPLLGIDPTATTTLIASEKPVVEGLPAAKAEPPLQGNDTIVAIEIAGKRFPTPDYYALRKVLAQHPDDTITVVVKRGKLEQNIKPNSDEDKRPEQKATILRTPMRQTAIVMNIGPVVAVQETSPIGEHSPAKDAGFQEGDILLSVNGHKLAEPFEENGRQLILGPFTLPHYIRRLAGKPVTFEVKREGEPQPITLTATPQLPKTNASTLRIGSPVSADALGLAYNVLNTVAYVRPESDAAKAGLQPGDTIQSVQFMDPNDDKKTERSEKQLQEEGKFIQLSGDSYWVAVHNRIQWSDPNTKFRVTFTHGDNGDEKTADLLATYSDEWSNTSRGFVLQTLQEIHLADSWGEAFILGLRNTKESLFHVSRFLKKLVTGGISPTNLGGPGAIAGMAGHEAMAGIPRLLLFLTLLSANLAIINFLPIPVLDGGHMVFLAYEGITGKPANETLATILSIFGLLFLLSLMVFVVGLDVLHFTGLL